MHSDETVGLLAYIQCEGTWAFAFEAPPMHHDMTPIDVRHCTWFAELYVQHVCAHDEMEICTIIHIKSAHVTNEKPLEIRASVRT